MDYRELEIPDDAKVEMTMVVESFFDPSEHVQKFIEDHTYTRGALFQHDGKMFVVNDVQVLFIKEGVMSVRVEFILIHTDRVAKPKPASVIDDREPSVRVLTPEEMVMMHGSAPDPI